VLAIRVKGYLTLGPVMENKELFEIQETSITLYQLLVKLAKRFGLPFEEMVFEADSLIIGPHVRILVNGRHYRTLPGQLDTEIGFGDDIGLFPPIAGG